MQLLPTEIPEQVNPNDFCPANYPNDSPTVFFLKVDFDYPEEWHNLTNGYSSAVEKIEENKYCLAINYKLNKIINFLLIPNLSNKGKYKLHYQNLKLCF